MVDAGKSRNPKSVEQRDWSHAQDKEYRQRWKRVVTCPSCRTNAVQVDLDEEAVRIRHRCTEKNCAFPAGLLPIYVIDNEIYRYLPSVIVGTIDKLAGLGNQRKFFAHLRAGDRLLYGTWVLQRQVLSEGVQ